MKMRVYVAASWRTAAQPIIVDLLRAEGYEVYDFRQDGFAWQQVDPLWESWTPEQYRLALQSPRAQEGFKRDYEAMRHAQVCVLVQPCGRSAHLELGWMAGVGKFTVVLLEEHQEPDLMYLLCDQLCVSVNELKWVLAERAVYLGAT